MSLKFDCPRYGEVDFGPIFCAPFVRGFFGSMHWPLYILYFFGLTWKGTGFAAKTVTLYRRKGNVKTDINGNVWSLWTKAIYFSFWKDCFVNAFGLGNPGLKQCLALNHWQQRKDPFILSFTSISGDKENRLLDASGIVKRLLAVIDDFKVPFAIQWGVGCPNAGTYRNMDWDTIADEVIEIFDIFRPLGVPLILNCNAFIPTEIVHKLHAHVDAFWIGNTIPVGHPSIDWEKIFKGGVSPLIRRGMKDFPGGYSGPEAWTLTINKVIDIRTYGIKTPIVAGNGLRYAWQIWEIQEMGADAVFMGSIILRPWRMRTMIRTAHVYFT